MIRALIGPPDPTGSITAHVEIYSDGFGGAYIYQWARWHDRLAFNYYPHHFRNIEQAKRSIGRSDETSEIFVNGEKV
jgi:hypothetical protein